MPKESRRRVSGHAPSVKLPKRQFAVQDNAVEHVELGSAADVPAQDLLESMDQPESSTAGLLKKKEKQQIKRDAFHQRLETTNAPYSKSHMRRVKRKAKEQIANGLGDIQTAIAALDDGDEAPELIGNPDADEQEHQMDETTKASTRRKQASQIGEGKATTLSKNQRKRALEMERLRHPLILSNPQFSSNPFQTIRTHAQNTLAKHVPPTV